MNNALSDLLSNEYELNVRCILKIIGSVAGNRAHTFLGRVRSAVMFVQFKKPDLPAGNYQMVVVSQTDAGEKFGVTHSLKL